MILSEWFTDDFLSKIEYLNTNESDNLTNLYWTLIANYGNKTVSPLCEIITDTQIIANIINMKYSQKWTLVKTAFSSDINLTGKTSSNTVTEENAIYGYNSDNGVKDYTNTKKTESIEEWDDVYNKIKEAFDFHDNLMYYKIIASDIAKELTTMIYE